MSIILKVGAQSMRVSNLTLAQAVDIAVTLAGSDCRMVMEPSPIRKVDMTRDRGPQA